MFRTPTGLKMQKGLRFNIKYRPMFLFPQLFFDFF